MGKRKAHVTEIICGCSAYEHPHRLGGGACDGAEWCTSFRSIDSFDCDTCVHSTRDGCDVVTGLEPLCNITCTCLSEEIRSGSLRDEYGFLPIDLEAHWEKKQRDYYENQEQ